MGTRPTKIVLAALISAIWAAPVFAGNESFAPGDGAITAHAAQASAGGVETKSYLVNFLSVRGDQFFPSEQDRRVLSEAIAHARSVNGEILIRARSDVRNNKWFLRNAALRAQAVERDLVRQGFPKERIRIIPAQPGDARSRSADVVVSWSVPQKPSVSVSPVLDASKPQEPERASSPTTAVVDSAPTANTIRHIGGGRFDVNWEGDPEALLRQVAGLSGLLFGVDGLPHKKATVRVVANGIPASKLADFVRYQWAGASVSACDKAIVIRYPVIVPQSVGALSLESRVAVRWSGDVRDLVSVLAERVGLVYAGELGAPVSLPVKVDVTGTVLEVFERIGAGIDANADLVLRDNRYLMIRFKEGGK